MATFDFDTAVSFATECIDRLHSTAEAHQRVMVVEVMGRYAGWIALHAGVSATADVILIPGIPYDTWGWSETQRALPYSVACMVFALMMVPAGRMQDKIGPRNVATIGGALTGMGLIFASRFTNIWMFVIGFGILAGSGIGFGYASATPPAVKWFPPAKTGMVVGIVVSGFGLASVYISPLANFLIGRYGVSTTMLIFGIGFLIVVACLSQFLTNPPTAQTPKMIVKGVAPPKPPAAVADFSPLPRSHLHHRDRPGRGRGATGHVPLPLPLRRHHAHL